MTDGKSGSADYLPFKTKLQVVSQCQKGLLAAICIRLCMHLTYTTPAHSEAHEH